MNSPFAYELKTIRKCHGDSFRLEIDALTIAAGESLCLVGPTGAGKSTLLRLLSGLDASFSGHINLQGRLLQLAAGESPVERLRRVATVPQRPILLSESVRYNVEYGLKIRGVKSPRQRSDPLLERLGLNRLASQDARTLSGGQIQLVAIARTLVVEPEVLLLDEPTAHLDPANVALVESLVQEKRQQLGMTVVWATHNLFQAGRMASRVGFLLSGRLIEVAETSIFFDNPADRRTLDFVQGRMVY